MFIKTITDQNRRDFKAVYKCEGCGAETLGSGYDDRNFHDSVLPDRKCPSCNQSRNDMGLVQPLSQTKYEPWEVV